MIYSGIKIIFSARPKREGIHESHGESINWTNDEKDGYNGYKCTDDGCV